MTISDSTVAIIGTGNIGSRLAANFAAGGQDFLLAGRDQEAARKIASDLDGHAEVVSIDDAVERADVLVLAVWPDAFRQLIAQYGEQLGGKVVVDPSNPVGPDGAGGYRKVIGEQESSGQILAGLLPAGARLVKAFGTLSAPSLSAAAWREPERAVLFYAADDAAAKLAADFNGHAEVVGVDEAVERAGVLVFAVWLDPFKELIAQYGRRLAGKVIVDPTNPVGPDEQGNYHKVIGEQESSGQILAGLLPAGARLVKAFGTLSAPTLSAAARREPERAVLFYAADDATAGDLVAELIRAGGYEPVRVGGLDQSIRIEMFGDLHEYGALGRAVTKPGLVRTVHVTVPGAGPGLQSTRYSARCQIPSPARTPPRPAGRGGRDS